MSKKQYLDASGVTCLIDNIKAQLNKKVEYSDLEDVQQASINAADRASQSAIVAGNYAAQAIQAQQALENKIWYGTMEEYNNLETVSKSTIYIILHE